MFEPIWGAATSAHQVEGNNQWNDWWAWEQAGRVRESSGKTCEHYERFREDFKLARSLGHTAHRFSLEWSRLEPEPGEWNEEAFRHYEEVFEALRAERLEPVVTLHHFTNPVWFAKEGGWLRPGARDRFCSYVRQAARRFGRNVRYWITFNEPLIYVYQGYVEGRWPPGEKDFSHAGRVIRELLWAHAAAYRILHEETRNPECAVSIAHHSIAFSPCRSHPLDRLSLFLREWFINRLAYQALVSGFLFYPGIFFEKLPFRPALDYLGVNYYSRDFVHFAGWWGMRQFGTVCPKEHHAKEVVEWNNLGWEVYPRGIYEVISSLRRFRLPILVTENGISSGDDQQRARFIRDHLREIGRARVEGAKVFGYFYWSLVDNFEWAEGFKPRFGIVEVDYPTGSRRVRPSAQVLRASCEKVFQPIHTTSGGERGDAAGTV